MAKRRIFISYDYDHDRHYKHLLLAWDKHSDFDFSFRDHSIDVSVNSISAKYIRSVISRAIAEAPYFLVIIGEKTFKSKWVVWEIEKAVALRKRIVAVKSDRLNRSLLVLLGVGASWAMSFTYLSISNAIMDAR